MTTVQVKRVIIEEAKPKFWVYAKGSDTSYLRHVYAVLAKLGFKRGNETNWDLLWAHEYPYRTLFANLSNLKPHQRVNHFPGCGYITNKVDLSTSSGKFMPAAFKLPDEKKEFLQWAQEHPEKSFVQKSNDHRGIQLRTIDELDLNSNDTFVQEFIEKPFLVDGFKFDVGIYTVITSIDPLRLYVYKADVLFRFCPVEYYPFDRNNLDKYIVGDDYLPIWNVPSLRKYYVDLGFSMKDTFDAYVRSIGKDPSKVWNDAYAAIKDVALRQEGQIKQVIKRFRNQRNYFELLRIDFTLDDELNVYLMEANMSPNLSSAHFPPNRLLYEQVIFNMFALVGIAGRAKKDSLEIRDESEREMEVADKNLVVLPELCVNCEDCFRVECQLCKPCFTEETKLILTQSYLENQNKMDFLRIFPPPIEPNMVLKDYTLRNQLLVRWYQGKCEIDPSWCN